MFQLRKTPTAFYFAVDCMKMALKRQMFFQVILTHSTSVAFPKAHLLNHCAQVALNASPKEKAIV